MSDYELILNIKNAKLLNVMRERGYETSAELSRASGVTQSDIGSMLKMSLSPILQSGKIRVSVGRICDFLYVGVDDIYPKERVNDPLENSVFITQLKGDQLDVICGSIKTTDLFIDEAVASGKVFEMMISKLTEREKKIITLKYVDDLNLGEIGKVEGVSRERVRQILSKAERKLRHPTRTKGISFVADHFLGLKVGEL